MGGSARTEPVAHGKRRHISTEYQVRGAKTMVQMHEKPIRRWFRFGAIELMLAVACISAAIASAILSPNDVSLAALKPWALVPIMVFTAVGLLTGRLGRWLIAGLLHAPLSVMCCMLFKWGFYWPK
jgi:hypothetical protein